jgi:hypothetical protein
LHEKPVVVHVESQHNPDTQFPLTHPPPDAQALPLGCLN